MSTEHLFLISEYIFLTTVLFDSFVAVLVLCFGSLSEKVHRYFLYTIGSIVGWEIALWMTFFFSINVFVDTVLNRLAFAFGPLIMFAFINLLGAFNQKAKTSKSVNYLMFANAIVIVIMCMAGFVVEAPIRYGEISYQFVLPPGPFYDYYYFAFLPFILVIAYQVTRIYKDNELTKEEKIRSNQLLATTGISLLIGLSSNIVFPLLFRLSSESDALDYRNAVLTFIQTFGAIATTVWTSYSAYAITRLKLFNIQVIVKNKIARLFFVLLIVVLQVSFSALLFEITDNKAILFACLYMLFFVTGYILLYLVEKRISIRDIDFYLPKEVTYLTEAGPDIDITLDTFSSELSEKFNAKKFTFVLFNPIEDRYQTYRKGKQVSFDESEPLVELSNRNRKIFSLNSTQADLDSKMHSKVVHGLLKRVGVNTAIPIQTFAFIYGFIFCNIPETLSEEDKKYIMELSVKHGEMMEKLLSYEYIARKAGLVKNNE